MTFKQIFTSFLFLLLFSSNSFAKGYIFFCPDLDKNGIAEKKLHRLLKHPDARKKLLNPFRIINKSSFKANELRISRAIKKLKKVDLTGRKSNLGRPDQSLAALYYIKPTLGFHPEGLDLFIKINKLLARQKWDLEEPEEAFFYGLTVRAFSKNFSGLKTLKESKLKNKVESIKLDFQSAVSIEINKRALLFFDGFFAGIGKNFRFVRIPEGFHFINVFRLGSKPRGAFFSLNKRESKRIIVNMQSGVQKKLINWHCGVHAKEKELLLPSFRQIQTFTKAKKVLYYNILGENIEVKIYQKHKGEEILTLKNIPEKAFMPFIYKQFKMKKLNKKDYFKTFQVFLGEYRKKYSSPKTKQKKKKKVDEPINFQILDDGSDKQEGMEFQLDFSGIVKEMEKKSLRKPKNKKSKTGKKKLKDMSVDELFDISQDNLIPPEENEIETIRK